MKPGRVCNSHKHIVLTWTSCVSVTCPRAFCIPVFAYLLQTASKITWAPFCLCLLFSPGCLLTYGTSSASLFLFQIYCIHLPEYMSFFLFIEVFPIHFSLYLTLFLKTPKACVMTRGGHISFLAPVCPGKPLLHRREPPLPGSLTAFYLWGEHSKLQGSWMKWMLEREHVREKGKKKENSNPQANNILRRL